MRALHHLVSGAALICLAAAVFAQQPLREWTTAEDHQQMMGQLGITALRPGPSGNENAADHANYDEALANPHPDLPDALALADGRKITRARDWWRLRRPQLIEDFEREVVGRVPPNAARITWSVTQAGEATIGGREVITRRLSGHADNREFPAIDVNLQMVLVTPKGVKRRAPVMVLFGRAALPGDPPPRSGFVPPPPPPGSDPPATEQLIRAGWGYAYLDPASIQADNGAGLTRGIIGLANRGQPRRPDDWGALRAWAWGASRALDFLEQDRAVDPHRVGIEGVSRYGKAALVAMAFDTRFAVVLVGSSGEGGAKLHRRNFGEAVENLTGAGEYHWMAGNFLKYGAAQSSFGSRNAGDLPVDAHMLLALCAPRPTFISYGIPEKGDAKWLDQQGSFMAAIASQPVYRLLGASDLGRSDAYRNEKMPPVNEGLLQGRLAWRQHDGGHTDGPNWKYFIPWANARLGLPVRGVPRQDANSMLAHQQLLQKTRAGRIDVYLLGDSITRRWGATDYPQFLPHWHSTFRGWNAANFGWGGDKVENILWRVENGEMDGLDPRVVVVMAGTNDVGNQLPPDGTGPAIRRISDGISTLIEAVRTHAPGATVILMGITPRGDNPAVMPVIRGINHRIARLADGGRMRYLDIGSRFLEESGRLREGMTVDGLHPALPGYQAWANALAPVLQELLGPRKSEDFAPPPTGNPAVAALSSRMIHLSAGGYRWVIPPELVTGIWTGPDSFSFNFVVSPPNLVPVADKSKPGLIRGTIDVNHSMPPLRSPRDVLETFFQVHGEVARQPRQYAGGIRGYLTDQTVHDEMYEYEGPDGSHYVWGCPPQLTALIRSCTVIRSWESGRLRAAFHLPWEYRLQVPQIDRGLLALFRSLEIQD